MDDRDLLRVSVAIQVVKVALDDLTAAFDSLPPEIKAAITAEPERGRLRANIPKEGGSNFWDGVLPDPREARLPDREQERPERESKPL